MKLIYRGTTYDYDSTQAKADRNTQPIDQEPYNLMYRGVSYHVDPRISRSVSTQARSYELIYRGCTYQVTRNEAGKMTSMNASTTLFKPKASTSHVPIAKIANKNL